MTIYDFLFAPFIDFLFMKRALLGGLAISLSAPPIGIFLTLKRMSMVGDAMTHAILPGVALGYLIAGLSIISMTIGGLLTGLTVALMSGLATRITIMKEDASFASFHLIALAFGVMLISWRGSTPDLLHILFGSILALDNASLILLIIVTIISMCSLAIIFRPLVIDSIDPEFLRLASIWGHITHPIFLCLIVINLIAGFHALGTLMAVGMMILPTVSARFWSSDLSWMILISIVISAISVYIGLLLSYHMDLPSSPSIILIAALLYAISLFTGRCGGIVWRYIRTHYRNDIMEV